MNIVLRNLKWICQKAASRCFKRDPNLWVFGEWFGNRCCDNSFYLANDIAERDAQIQPIWICDTTADVSDLNPRIQVVHRNTPEAIETLKRAGVVVYNQSLSDFSSEMCLYALGAVTINLWHGVPWKKIGADAVSDEHRVQYAYTRYLLKLQRPTYYLATSDSFADILCGAYCTKPDRILKTGYPRNSIFYRKEAMAAARAKVLDLLGKQASAPLDPNTKIISYMPTFRDRTQETFSFDTLAQDARLQELLERHNAVIVQKAHAVNDLQRREHDESTNRRMFRLNKVIPMELLAATDLLITDYSGCFFDYLLTDRPIIHYLYDYDYYVNQDRGVYYSKDEVVGGDVAQTVSELLDAMEENLKDPGRHASLRQKRRAEYMTYESEDGCQTVYEQLKSRLRK